MKQNHDQAPKKIGRIEIREEGDAVRYLLPPIRGCATPMAAMAVIVGLAFTFGAIVIFRDPHGGGKSGDSLVLCSAFGVLGPALLIIGLYFTIGRRALTVDDERVRFIRSILFLRCIRSRPVRDILAVVLTRGGRYLYLRCRSGRDLDLSLDDYPVSWRAHLVNDLARRLGVEADLFREVPKTGSGDGRPETGSAKETRVASERPQGRQRDVPLTPIFLPPSVGAKPASPPPSWIRPLAVVVIPAVVVISSILGKQWLVPAGIAVAMYIVMAAFLIYVAFLLLKRAALRLRLERPQVWASVHPLRIGEHFEVNCTQVVKTGGRLQGMRARLFQCEVARWSGDGSEERKTEYSLGETVELIGPREVRPGDVLEGIGVLRIPPHGMHTFRGSYNSVEWFLRVETRLESGALVDHFRIEVEPVREKETEGAP